MKKNYKHKRKCMRTEKTIELHSYTQYLAQTEDANVDALAADMAYIAIEAMGKTRGNYAYVQRPKDLEGKKEICARKILMYGELMELLKGIMSDPDLVKHAITVDFKAMARLLLHWTEQCFPALLKSIKAGKLKLNNMDEDTSMGQILTFLDKKVFTRDVCILALGEFNRFGIYSEIGLPMVLLAATLKKAVKFVTPEERKLIMQKYGVDMDKIGAPAYNGQQISEFAQKAFRAPVMTGA